MVISVPRVQISQLRRESGNIAHHLVTRAAHASSRIIIRQRPARRNARRRLSCFSTFYRHHALQLIDALKPNTAATAPRIMSFIRSNTKRGGDTGAAARHHGACHACGLSGGMARLAFCFRCAFRRMPAFRAESSRPARARPACWKKYRRRKH